jgi:hypothetical protein
VADYMRLVRAVADDLGSVRTAEDLPGAWGRATDVAEAAARRQGLADRVPDLEIVAGAAFALRHRELRAEAGWQETRRRIDQARGRGDAWVVVHEAGVPEAPFPVPYGRVEMRVADGLALHLSAELDPDTNAVVYAVEVLHLDPVSGQVAEEAEPRRATFTDPEAWRRAARELRDQSGV